MGENDYPYRAQFRRLVTDYFADVAMGMLPTYKSVNKFGYAPSGVQTTETDIWDRADATPTQSVWLPPTQARVHAIVSSSAQDAVGGTGSAQIVVYGLTSWQTAEVSETLTLTGATPVNTSNSYVIIHRMKCIPQATSTSANVGTITATAATDATVTAQIGPGNGQTEMAIYGVPSIQKALLYSWSVAVDRATAAGTSIDFILRVNENPQTQRLAYLRKDDQSVQSTGTSQSDRMYRIPPVFAGPCIIKVTGAGSAADVDAKAGFDLILVTI